MPVGYSVRFDYILGCDTTSSFFGKGKAAVLKVVQKKVEYKDMFAGLGENLFITPDVYVNIENFVCHLYGNEAISSVNELRYLLFKGGKYAEEQLPPTLDALKQHLLRCNYQAYIWKHATSPQLNMPSFLQYGWIMDGDELKIKWLSNEVAPDSILNFVSCKCASGCETRRCSCRKAELTCSDLCQCSNCCNSKSDLDEEKEHEDVFDDLN